MKTCIYCKKNNKKTTFRGKEHIMPRCLGRFSPDNPTIKDVICDDCNSKFSKLESNFKEDSLEGVTGQQLNLEGHSSVRIRGKNLKMDCLSPFGDKFFNQIFPFLKIQNNEFVIEFKPQVKIKNYCDGYQIFLPEALQKIKQNPRKFEDTKNKLKTVKQQDIRIFAGAEKESDRKQLNEIISLLSDYGITYKEKKSKFTPVGNTEGKKFEIKIDGKVDKDLARVIAKIAFNYFIFCCMEESMLSVLRKSNFNKIKKFIFGEEPISLLDKIKTFFFGKKPIKLKDVVRPAKDDAIYFDEKKESDGKTSMRYIGHTILFTQEDGYIISKVTLFGKSIYEVKIGKIPKKLLRNDFGCGHFFNPFTGKIIGLTQNPYKDLSKIKLSFGLFKRL